METQEVESQVRKDYPWDQCIADQTEKYGDEETAKKVCGMIKAKYGSGLPEDMAKAREEAEAALGMSERAAEATESALDEPQGRMFYTRALANKAANVAEDPSAPVWFRASTEGVKRDGLDLKASDWITDTWREYPIVLFGHDYMGRNLPIGLGEAKMEGKELHIGVRYDADDPFAMQVRAKALKGMIAGSVGWEDIKRGGEVKHSLTEFSMVPMPADPKSLPLRQARALRSLADVLEGIDDDPPPAPEGEPAWPEVAAAMVACFTPAGDEPEEARLERYNALVPKYRRLGKTAPEWLDAATVSALGPAERRGLFLSDEPELCPDAFAEPEPPQGGDDGAAMGSTLAEIQARLETRALQGILDRLAAMGVVTQRAQAPAPTPEPPTSGDDGAGRYGGTDAQPQIDNALRAILEKLESRT
jgi:hypothetical protein